jgi:hypothetical protein
MAATFDFIVADCGRFRCSPVIFIRKRCELAHNNDVTIDACRGNLRATKGGRFQAYRLLAGRRDIPIDDDFILYKLRAGERSCDSTGEKLLT